MPRRAFSIPLPRCEVIAYYHMCHHLRLGDTVVDIGAHVGQNTLLAAALVGPRGQVYAVEPVPKLREEIEKKLKNHDLHNVTILPYAATSPEDLAGRESKERALFIDQRSECEIMYHLWTEDKEAAHRHGPAVICKTIDDIFCGVPEVHLIKIDVEGWDVAALKGCKKLIQRSPNLALLIEIWPYGLKRCGSSLEEMLDILVSHEMQIYILDERKKAPIRIDPYTKLNLPLPDPTKPESLTNSHVNNLWCIKHSWDLGYNQNRENAHTAGEIGIVWK